jgi:ArsR family transcriptional regulator, arsenate/arsenite/antimonite-responsive transcriptional repressor
MTDLALLRLLKALSHPIRFRMVQEIAAATELSCGQIGERFDLAQPTISHHLKILHDAGVLAVRRAAQHAFVSVNRPLVDAALERLPDRLAPGRRIRRVSREP